MPFTFSHPAAVLPLGKLPGKYISVTGLVIGSMVPDFEYFIRMHDRSDFSHSWGGIFYFDLPLSLILAFAYHLFVRNTLIDHLPGFLARRLQDFKKFDWSVHFRQAFITIIISIIIGATSHIVWDGFSHAHGLFVDMFPFFNRHVPVAGHHIPVFVLMQHGGSIAGALLILYSIWILPPDSSFNQDYRSFFGYWTAICVLMLLVALFRLKTTVNEYENFDEKIVLLISGWLLGLFVVSLSFNYVNNDEKQTVAVKKNNN